MGSFVSQLQAVVKIWRDEVDPLALLYKFLSEKMVKSESDLDFNLRHVFPAALRGDWIDLKL